MRRAERSVSVASIYGASCTCRMAGMDEGGEHGRYLTAIHLKSAYYGQDTGEQIPLQGRISVVNMFRLFYRIHHNMIYMDDAAHIPFAYTPGGQIASLTFGQFYALRYVLGLQDTYSHQMYPTKANVVAMEVEAQADSVTEDIPLTEVVPTVEGLHAEDGQPQIQKFIDAVWGNKSETYNGKIHIGDNQYNIEARVQTESGEDGIHLSMDNRQSRIGPHPEWGVRIRIERHPLDKPLGEDVSAGPAPLMTPPGKRIQSSDSLFYSPRPSDLTPGSMAMFAGLQALKSGMDAHLALEFYEALASQKGEETMPQVEERFRDVVSKLRRFHQVTARYADTSPVIRTLARRASQRREGQQQDHAQDHAQEHKSKEHARRPMSFEGGEPDHKSEGASPRSEALLGPRFSGLKF